MGSMMEALAQLRCLAHELAALANAVLVGSAPVGSRLVGVPARPLDDGRPVPWLA